MMSKYVKSILYVSGLLGAWYVMKLVVETKENPFSFYENPLMWILFMGTLLTIFMKEILTLMALDKINNSDKKRVKSTVQSGKLPWWLFLIYGIIFLGSIYFFSSSTRSYRVRPQESEITGSDNKQTPVANRPDATTAQVLRDAGSLRKGKAIFYMYCASCHAKDGGGGVGPNLTDSYWIIGGDMENIFRTIQNGGRPGKGMLSWKRTIKPEDIEKLGSYVISLQGKKPQNPKAPQGEFWEN